MIKKILLSCLLLVSASLYSQLSFSDVASLTGVGVSYGNSTFGGGVSFADFDNDGWDDITFSSDENNRTFFFKNNNGTFSNITLVGINHMHKTKQVIWVDYDNDGDKDFFATSISDGNKFYRNNGDMTFTDITNTVGIFTDNKFSYGASFGDIDNDGDLDLFISNRGDSNISERNYLYKNESGTFVDITSSAGIQLVGELSFCSAIFDYDNDGDQDIFVANDKGDKMNRLYRNKGDGTFDDVSIASGTGVFMDAMSTTIGDYNNDGWFDIYVTNTPSGNYFFENNGGSGTFTNVASSTETEFNSFAWGSTFLDADNDSNLDLYVSGMLDGSVSSLISSAFYSNDGDGTFTIPSGIGFDGEDRASYSNAIGDYNNDGKPDIIVMNDTDNNYLWKNESVNSNNWIKIKLEGVSSNRDGIGNKIEINAGGKSQYRYTLAGEGYIAQNSSFEFVGLDAATNIDYIKVTWNKTGIVETINNITPNQAITIKEGNGIVLSTSTEELNSFSVYPNPSNNGLFYLSITNDEVHQIEVTDLTGRQIFINENIISSDHIDLSKLSSGVYLAKITSGKKSKVVKLIRN